MKLPGRDRAVAPRAGRDLDHAAGTEIRPGELLLPRPDDLDRLAGRLRQPRRLDGRVAGVLAAVGGAGVGDLDAHALGGNAESLRQLVAHGEGALRPGPDGQLVAVPFRDRRPRLERRVRDVLDRVGPRELDLRGRHPLLDGALDLRRTLALLLVLLEILEELLVGRLRRHLPFRLDVGEGALGRPGVGRDDADEVRVPDDFDSRHLRLARVGRDEPGLEPRRPQHLAVQHPGPGQVRRVPVLPRDEVAASHLRNGGSGDFPLARRNQRGILVDDLDETLSARQLAVRDRLLRLRIRDLPGRSAERGAVGVPAPCRQVHELLARRRRRAAQLRPHGRSGPAAEGPGVPRDEVRVTHHHPDRIDRHAQLLGDLLRERRADVLPHLDLAGEDGDVPVLGDVEPRADVPRELPPAARAPRFLRGRGGGRETDEDPSAQDLEEGAAVHVEPVQPASHRVLVELAIKIGIGPRVFLHHAFRMAFAARWTAARIRG